MLTQGMEEKLPYLYNSAHTYPIVSWFSLTLLFLLITQDSCNVQLKDKNDLPFPNPAGSAFISLITYNERSFYCLDLYSYDITVSVTLNILQNLLHYLDLAQCKTPNRHRWLRRAFQHCTSKQWNKVFLNSDETGPLYVSIAAYPVSDRTSLCFFVTRQMLMC